MQKANKVIIDEAAMLEEIRFLLNLTIEDFVYQMNWPNVKYYDFIKNGRRRKQNPKTKSHPTIHKVFTGINVAINERANWQKHASEITTIVIKHLLPSLKNES